MASSTKGPTKPDLPRVNRGSRPAAACQSRSSAASKVALTRRFSPSFKGAPVYPNLAEAIRGLIPFRSSGSGPTPRLRCDQDAASARGSAEHDGHTTRRGDRPGNAQTRQAHCAATRARFLRMSSATVPMTIALALERSPSRERATSAVQTHGTKARGWRKAPGTILPMKAAEKMPYRRPRRASRHLRVTRLGGRLPQCPFRQTDAGATVSCRHRPVARQAARPVGVPRYEHGSV